MAADAEPASYSHGLEHTAATTALPFGAAVSAVDYGCLATDAGRPVELRGDVPDPSRVPRGCRLHPRCPFATEECRGREPVLVEAGRGHWVACHRPFR